MFLYIFSIPRKRLFRFPRKKSNDYNFPLCTYLTSRSFNFSSAESVVEINVKLLELSVQNCFCSERHRCFMSIARPNNQLNNILLAKFSI